MPPAPNRSFFGNFFAAFRAQPSYSKAAPSALTASAHPAVSSPHGSATSSNTPSQQQSRTLTTKSSHHQPTTSSTAAVVAAHAAAQFSSHRGRPSSTPPLPGNSSPVSAARSPPPISSPTTTSDFQRSRTPSETRLPPRRGSSCSSEGRGGLRDAFGASGAAGTTKGAAAPNTGQNWYIGGRTASGEEVFYKLGVVKRYRSADKLSLDRLSL